MSFSRLMKKWGVLSRFAGSLRVSLRYNFFPFLTRKGAIAPALSIVEGMVERVFQRPVKVPEQDATEGADVLTMTDRRVGLVPD